MALELFYLDERTHPLMREELNWDISKGRLCLSSRLSDRGQADWPELFREAIETGDEQSLAHALRFNDRLSLTEPRRTRSGGSSVARVPITAPETLAEGEFNRLYMRAICRRADEDGQEKVEVYRAKQVRQPRPESQRTIGQRIDAAALLEDLRPHPGTDTALRLPAGPNSGLSVRLSGEATSP